MPKKSNHKKTVNIKLTKEQKANVVYKGKDVYQYTFRADKGVDNDYIEKFLKTNQQLKDVVKGAKKGHNKDVEFAVTTYLPQGPRTSKFSLLKTINCYDMTEDSKTAMDNQDNIRSFVVYMRVKNEATGGTRNDHNDCLYYCLKDGFGNAELLPKQIRKPSGLKSCLGLERDDCVPLDKLHILEEKFNISFTVSGDYTYVSRKSKPINICLNLTAEHYTLKCNKKRDRPRGVFFEPANNINVFKKRDDGIIEYYCGDKVKEISYNEYENLIDFKHQSVNLHCNLNQDIIEEFNKYRTMTDTLIKETKGYVNLYKYMSIRAASFDLWRQMSKNLVEPDDINDVEGIYLDRAFRGGHHWYEDYEGHGISYDLNSMYLYYMSSLGFTAPFSKGEFKTYTQKEFEELKFYPYGIYRCLIKGSNKFFTPAKNCYYTHFDLQLAKELNLEINIIEDSSANCLIYDKNRVNGNKMFGQFKEYFYKLKKDGLPVKDIISRLWGAFTKKNTKTSRGRVDKPLELNAAGDYMEEIYECGDATFVKHGNVNAIFCNNYARIGVFLTAYCRLKFIRLCMPFEKHIKRINTDSMLTDIDISDKLDIGKELGQFKIEYNAQCKVVTSNRVIFYDEEGNIIKKT